jgi:hypothetical protein
MPRVISPESAEGKELLKHEQWPANWNGTRYEPGNPYVFRPFPKMVYRATAKENGKVVCMEAPPEPDRYEKPVDYDRALRLHDQLMKACTKIVPDESAYLVAKGQGWCDDPTLALEAYEAQQRALGDAAAERLFRDQRMTRKAQDEAAMADISTHEHVGDVPAPKLKPKQNPAPPARVKRPEAVP